MISREVLTEDRRRVSIDDNGYFIITEAPEETTGLTLTIVEPCSGEVEQVELADGATSIDPSLGEDFITANTEATVITTLGVATRAIVQHIRVEVDDNYTSVDESDNIVFYTGTAPYAASPGDILNFVWSDAWAEWAFYQV